MKRGLKANPSVVPQRPSRLGIDDDDDDDMKERGNYECVKTVVKYNVF